MISAVFFRYLPDSHKACDACVHYVSAGRQSKLVLPCHVHHGLSGKCRKKQILCHVTMDIPVTLVTSGRFDAFLLNVITLVVMPKGNCFFDMYHARRIQTWIFF